MARSIVILGLALFAVADAVSLKTKAKPRAHVDTCLEANTHVFLGLNGENIQAQMPYVEEACDASKGCAMFKKSEVAFHRNAGIPQLSQLMHNAHLKNYDFEVCLPQTSCLEEELSTGAVVYAASCRYNEKTGQRLETHIPTTNEKKNGPQGCQCGLQSCIDQCVDADTNERDTIECAYYCQSELTTNTLTFVGNFMCEAPKKGHWVGFRQATIKMAKAHNDWVEKFNEENGEEKAIAEAYDMPLVEADHRNYFYDCEAADQRPSKYIAKTFGLPNLLGDLSHWLGITNKF